MDIKKKLVKLKKNWVLLVILSVSALSFVNGFIQNTYASAAEDGRSVVAERQKQLNMMEGFMDQMESFDIDQYRSADSQLVNAFNQYIEYINLNSTYSAIERDTKLNVIYINFIQAFFIFNDTYSQSIQESFEFRDTQLYIIATFEEDGYNYSITRENWQENKPGRFISAKNFLLEYGFDDSFITEFFNYTGSDFPESTLVFDINFQNLYKLHDKYLHESQKEIIELSKEAASKQNVANELTIAVSMVTVATILSTAMSSRIAERKNDKALVTIRKEILKLEEDKLFDEVKIDEGSLLGLIISLFVAIYSLIAAIMIILIPIL